MAIGGASRLLTSFVQGLISFVQQRLVLAVGFLRSMCVEDAQADDLSSSSAVPLSIEEFMVFTSSYIAGNMAHLLKSWEGRN